jgi:hypothetical protein
VNERNASLAFNGELDNDHYDAFLSLEEKKRLGIFDKVCSYRQALQREFPLHTSTT